MIRKHIKLSSTAIACHRLPACLPALSWLRSAHARARAGHLIHLTAEGTAWWMVQPALVCPNSLRFESSLDGFPQTWSFNLNPSFEVCVRNSATMYGIHTIWFMRDTLILRLDTILGLHLLFSYCNILQNRDQLSLTNHTACSLAIPMGARQGLFHVPRRARHARTEYVVNPAASWGRTRTVRSLD